MFVQSIGTVGGGAGGAGGDGGGGRYGGDGGGGGGGGGSVRTKWSADGTRLQLTNMRHVCSSISYSMATHVNLPPAPRAQYCRQSEHDCLPSLSARTIELSSHLLPVTGMKSGTGDDGGAQTGEPSCKLKSQSQSLH